jgi:hypothetical protein
MAAALGLGVIALALQPAERSLAQWKGYRVLLVDATVPEAEVLASLKGAGIKDVLSDLTQPVSVSDWAGSETMTLAAAHASIVPGDPRLDTYLQRLGLWFEARVGGVDYRAFYIRMDNSFAEAGFEKKVAAALLGHEGRFVLADFGNASAVRKNGGFAFAFAMALLLIAAAAGPLIGKTSPSVRALFSRRPGVITLDRIVLRLVLILPWAVLASGGLLAAALAVLWGFASVELADKLDIPLDEFRNGNGRGATIRSLRSQGRPSLVLPAMAVIALSISPGSIASIAAACVGSIIAAIGYAFATKGFAVHQRFIPVRIGGARRRRQVFAAEKLRGLLACIVAVLWGISGFVPASALPLDPAAVTFPTPVAMRGNSRPLPTEARSRGLSETGANLPGIASYLAHRAFQESLPYIPMGEGRPDPFAAASLPLPGGKAKSLSFDDDWARQAYATLPSLSIEGMLLVQGSATTGRASVERQGPSGRPLAPIEGLLYIFLLVPPIARLVKGIPQARGVPSGELRQEA